VQTDLAQADSLILNLASLLEQAQSARSELRSSVNTQVRLITIKKFCELTGYTEKGVNCKISTGVWLEGYIMKKAPDGRRLIDLQEYEKWAEGECSWA